MVVEAHHSSAKLRGILRQIDAETEADIAAKSAAKPRDEGGPGALDCVRDERHRCTQLRVKSGKIDGKKVTFGISVSSDSSSIRPRT